jgi:hypothetical protein
MSAAHATMMQLRLIGWLRSRDLDGLRFMVIRRLLAWSLRIIPEPVRSWETGEQYTCANENGAVVPFVVY